MLNKLVTLAVVICLLLPALPAHAGGPITLGMGMLSSIAMSPDGGRLAVGTSIGVYFYDPMTFAPQGYWDTGYEVDYIRWSPRGDVLALVHDNYDVDFWSLSSGKAVWSTKVCYRCAILFDADGAQVRVATDDTSSTAFEVLTGASLGVVPGYLGARVDWFESLSPDRQWHATVELGGDINLHLAAGSHSRDLTLPNEHGDLFQTRHSVTWSPDSRELFSIVDNAVSVWDVATGQKVRDLSGFSASVNQIMWASDGRHVITAEGQQIVLSDVATRLPVQASTPLPEIGTIWATPMVMDPAGRWIAVATYEDSVVIYDANTLQEVQHINVGRFGVGLALSPDGQTLATAGSGPFINIWDVSSGRPKFDLLGSPANPGISALTFSLDGQSLLALEDDHTLRNWNLAARTSTAVRLSTGGVTDRFYGGIIDLSANRVVLTSGGFQCSIVVDDATTGLLIRGLTTQDYCGTVVINAQGTWLADADRHSIEMWDLETGQRLAAYASQNGYGINLAFSPDGKSLASASWDYGKVQIWPVP